MANGLSDDIGISAFHPDPFAVMRAPTPHAEVHSFNVLGPRKKAKTWLGMEAVSSRGIKFFDHHIYAQDLVSLTSKVNVELSVLDLYFQLCLRWRSIHDGYEVGRVVSIEISQAVFGKAPHYADMMTDNARRDCLEEARDSFQAIWNRWSLGQWMFPVKQGAVGGGRSGQLTPATVFFINICVEPGQRGQTTQDLLLLQGADEECEAANVWICLEESVTSGVIEALQPWEKQLYLTFAADLLQFMANGIGLKLTVTTRPILEPQSVPPINLVSDPGDVALPSMIWFRNRVLSTEPNEPGDEREHFVDYSRDLGNEHVAHVLIFLEIMSMEIHAVTQARIFDLQRYLVSGMFYPVLTHPSNPGSYNWSVKTVPELEKKYPAFDVKRMRERRALSIHTVNVFDKLF